MLIEACLDTGMSKENKGAVNLMGERALTEFGSSFEPKASEAMSDDDQSNMNTAQNNIALE
jgi:hypothetical protein